MTQFDIDVCTRVAALMDNAGYGIGVKLSRVLNCSTTKITEIKKGEKPLKCEDIVKLSKYFGVSTAFLLTGEDAKPEPKAVDTEEKEGPGVPEVLDALQVLLETLEPAIRLVPYKVTKTVFIPGLAFEKTNDNGIPFVTPAFVDREDRFYSINIDNDCIQEVLKSFDTSQDIERQRPEQKELFRDRIFREDVSRMKERYDTIDPLVGAFYNSDNPSVFIDDRGPFDKRGSNVPCAINGSDLKENFRVFSKWYAEDGSQIENHSRETFIEVTNCTEESLDQALSDGDLHKLIDQDTGKPIIKTPEAKSEVKK